MPLALRIKGEESEPCREEQEAPSPCTQTEAGASAHTGVLQAAMHAPQPEKAQKLLGLLTPSPFLWVLKCPVEETGLK